MWEIRISSRFELNIGCFYREAIADGNWMLRNIGDLT